MTPLRPQAPQYARSLGYAQYDDVRWIDWAIEQSGVAIIGQSLIMPELLVTALTRVLCWKHH
jgi:hypothetical protein